MSTTTRTVLLAVAVLGALAAPSAASADAVTDWNTTLIDAQTIAAVPGPPGTRQAAIVEASVFDAVNGIRPRFTFVHVRPAGPRFASRDAAAVAAAHEALRLLLPAQAPLFDARYAASLATLHGSARSIDAGLEWGTHVADEIAAWRANDGSAAVLPPYVIGTDPGDWQPTPPAFVLTPAFRTAGVTQPFGLLSPSQFRPPGPPALTSPRYAAAFNEVKEFGSLNSTVRSPAQTQTALFWASDSPTALWNRVAQQLLRRHHASLLGEARVLALLNMAQCDGAIGVWEAKNFYDTWRPITAIRAAAGDGNPATSPDPAWQPLIVTPPFQEYPSGHAGVSSAGAGILAGFFGARTSFFLTSPAFPGEERHFTRFAAALNDVADARTFAGIHFRTASVDAIALGQHVAHFLRRTMLRPRDGHRHRRH